MSEMQHEICEKKLRTFGIRQKKKEPSVWLKETEMYGGNDVWLYSIEQAGNKV